MTAKHAKRHGWKVVEYAMTVIGVSASVGLALLNPLAALGATGPIAGFGGWIAGKRAVPESREPRPLGGASTFTMAHERLKWAG